MESHTKQQDIATEKTPFPKRASKAAATRTRILDAATGCFLNDGYSQTSLDKVALEASTTKPTVYSHFKSKQDLFNAVIQRAVESPLGSMSDVLQPTDDPKDDLIRFGDAYLSLLLNPQRQRWDRLAAAESMTNPEIGRVFFEAGPARLLKHVTGYLKAQNKSGRLQVTHPWRAAEQLIGVLICLDLLRMQIGQPLPSSAQRKRRCREAVDLFLSTYGVD
jgi:TetR/AcrR family transcriptional repressor of mexJK operon